MGEHGQYDQHTINEELARFSIEQMDKLEDYVKLEDLQDGITFDNLNANSLTVDGKDVSLVGHKHVVSDIDDLNGLWSIPGAEAAATNATKKIESATSIQEIKDATIEFLSAFKRES